MDELNQNELEGLLAMLGDGLGVPSPAKEPLEARVRRLGDAVRAATHSDQAHLSLADLQAALASRQSDGQNWLMPEHLSACPICLETFQILLEEGWPGVEPAVLERFVAVGTRQQTPAAPVPWILRLRRSPRVWALAAAVAIAATLVWYFMPDQSIGHTSQGGFRIADSDKPVIHDISPDTILDAPAETKANFADGSVFTIGAKSRLAFHREKGDTTIDLKFGHLVAQVVHQRDGHKFRVTTPLGEVRVVGTKFSVTSRSERVEVSENGSGNITPKRYKDQVTAVDVAVEEGVVTVKNSVEEKRVSAGQRATLYDQPPRIQLAEN